MKTKFQVPFSIKEVSLIPELMESGVIYYSEKYQCANHLCACGCGEQVPIPINNTGWTLIVKNEKVTIHPSIQRRNGCKSHYVVRNGCANIL